MRRLAAVCGAAAIFLAGAGFAAQDAVAAPTDQPERTYAAQVLNLINSARADAAIPGLLLAAGATEVSSGWVANLAQSQRVANNPYLAAELRGHGSPHAKTYGESVASGSRFNAQQVFDQFQSSSSNRRVLLDPAMNFIGISAAFVGDVAYVVADFVDSYGNVVRPATGPARTATPPIPPIGPATTVTQGTTDGPGAIPSPTPVAPAEVSPSLTGTESSAPVLDRAITTVSSTHSDRVGLFAAIGGLLDGFLIVALAGRFARRRVSPVADGSYDPYEEVIHHPGSHDGASYFGESFADELYGSETYEAEDHNVE